MTVEEFVVEMIHLFDGGRGWTQHSFARTANGTPTSVNDPRAARFCLMAAGARLLPAATDFQRTKAWREFRARLVRVIWGDAPERDVLFGSSLMAWNDRRLSYGEVEAALRAVIEDGK